MTMVLTLIVNPHNAGALISAEQRAREVLTAADTSVTLSEGEAIDLPFDGAVDRARLTAALATLPVDWAVQPLKSRKKKLFLADMDSTMITVECIDELADFAGIKEHVALITEAAMRGELDFEGALTERVALLKGLSADTLETCYRERVSFMNGARTLVQTLVNNGVYTALVSGGFTFFTGRVAEGLGFNMHRSNILEMQNGALTGRVVPPICGAQTKLDTLRELTEKIGLSADDSLAVGDGANDIPMIKAAGLGVAYHAKPKTAAAAMAAIHHTDLTALLFMQGYKKADFAP